jgi:hypothetical protein
VWGEWSKAGSRSSSRLIRNSRAISTIILIICLPSWMVAVRGCSRGSKYSKSLRSPQSTRTNRCNQSTPQTNSNILTILFNENSQPSSWTKSLNQTNSYDFDAYPVNHLTFLGSREWNAFLPLRPSPAFIHLGVTYWVPSKLPSTSSSILKYFRLLPFRKTSLSLKNWVPSRLVITTFSSFIFVKRSTPLSVPLYVSPFLASAI